MFWLLECGLRALVRVGGKKPTGSCTTRAHYDATLLKTQKIPCKFAGENSLKAESSVSSDLIVLCS